MSGDEDELDDADGKKLSEHDVLLEWLKNKGRLPAASTASLARTSGSAVSARGSTSIAQVRQALLVEARRELEAEGYVVRTVHSRGGGEGYLRGVRDDGTAVSFPLVNLSLGSVARDLVRALSSSSWPSSVRFYMADVEPINVNVELSGLRTHVAVKRVSAVPVTPRDVRPFAQKLLVEISSFAKREDALHRDVRARDVLDADVVKSLSEEVDQF